LRNVFGANLTQLIGAGLMVRSAAGALFLPAEGKGE
jgi:hypothetical protein